MSGVDGQRKELLESEGARRKGDLLGQAKTRYVGRRQAVYAGRDGWRGTTVTPLVAAAGQGTSDGVERSQNRIKGLQRHRGESAVGVALHPSIGDSRGGSARIACALKRY